MAVEPTCGTSLCQGSDPMTTETSSCGSAVGGGGNLRSAAAAATSTGESPRVTEEDGLSTSIAYETRNRDQISLTTGEIFDNNMNRYHLASKQILRLNTDYC